MKQHTHTKDSFCVSQLLQGTGPILEVADRRSQIPLEKADLLIPAGISCKQFLS